MMADSKRNECVCVYVCVLCCILCTQTGPCYCAHNGFFALNLAFIPPSLLTSLPWEQETLTKSQILTGTLGVRLTAQQLIACKLAYVWWDQVFDLDSIMIVHSTRNNRWLWGTASFNTSTGGHWGQKMVNLSNFIWIYSFKCYMKIKNACTLMYFLVTHVHCSFLVSSGTFSLLKQTLLHDVSGAS